MIVTRWEMPIVVCDDGLRFSIGSPEEAITWLRHERADEARRFAIEACEAARVGKLPAEQAREAVEKAAKIAVH
jgi:hypothetical protein